MDLSVFIYCRMLENKAFRDTFCWGPDGTTFIVKDTNEFSKTILPKHFKHCNFASFVRQLNKYDFHKVRNADDGHKPYGDQVNRRMLIYIYIYISCILICYYSRHGSLYTQSFDAIGKIYLKRFVAKHLARAKRMTLRHLPRIRIQRLMANNKTTTTAIQPNLYSRSAKWQRRFNNKSHNYSSLKKTWIALYSGYDNMTRPYLASLSV